MGFFKQQTQIVVLMY